MATNAPFIVMRVGLNIAIAIGLRENTWRV